MTGGAVPRKHWYSPQPARTDTVPIPTGRAYAEVLVVFGAFFASGIALAAFNVAGVDLPSTVHGWREAVPASIDQVATVALCILVPVLLARRRGLENGDLGLIRPRDSGMDGWQHLRIGAWALLALIAGSVVTGLLATGKAQLGDKSAPSLVIDLFHSAQAGPLEEIVVLAFLVTTLEQARRPLGEIVAVAVLLRASFHIYYGPGVVGIVVWASVFLWLFLRFRTIVPLIVVHSLWDLSIVATHYWAPAGGITVLTWGVVFLTSFITWLIHRSERGRPTGALHAPPGWYPDPAGSAGIRWFDGRQWAPVAYPPARPQPVPPPPQPVPPQAKPAQPAQPARPVQAPPGSWPGSGWPA